MGNCDSNNNRNKQAKKVTRPFVKNEANKNIENNKKKNMIEECIIKNYDHLDFLPSLNPFEKLESYSNIAKSICKLEIGNRKGTGFLLEFLIDQELFFCLISNEHIIEKKFIKSNTTLYVSYDIENKMAKIILDEKERYIKSFEKDYCLDITIVEILDKDNIFENYFLYGGFEIRAEEIINCHIYIPQYPYGEELVSAKGDIKEINGYELTHLANTEHGSSGSPILFEKTNIIIGIHKGCNTAKTENYGNLIYPAINIIEKDIRIKRYNGKYEDGIYIYGDGKYYLGEFKNDIPNGKGIKYYKNGNILYEGDFINDKFEGNGKLFFENGLYYIGKYKNGLRNGKGKIYYANGNIRLEGDYINDKTKGIGKFIWKDGACLVGQFKNELPYGKGKLYDPNGNIRFEGDYIYGKREEIGKSIYEDGTYYIGQWKNDFRNGKGKEYYANGNIRFEGNYNDKREGIGKYFYEDGAYYIGQFKKDFANGKGKQYYPNGNIEFEGGFINGKREGIGKFFYEDGTYYIGQFKNNLNHGKGKEYYANGIIRFEGDYINGKREGNGKYFYKDGSYYIGQFKNGLRNGKGIAYYTFGDIEFEGNWINDVPL